MIITDVDHYLAEHEDDSVSELEEQIHAAEQLSIGRDELEALRMLFQEKNSVRVALRGVGLGEGMLVG